MGCKNIVILGSTGSIGINTLKVVERYPERFKVVGLTAYNNFKLLEKQAKKFQPTHLGVSDKGVAYLKKKISSGKTKILSVNRDLESIVSLKNVDVVVIAMRGAGALGPFLAAVRSGKIVAPANKEALVMAGDIIMQEAREHGATIVPIDSEQSAIFQCLNGQKRSELKKVFLTASGGALLNVPKSKFNGLTVGQILSHPRWKMGKKITVDSATMMNKGFEVIEAQKLFNLKTDEIDVLIHPEAIIHSMVEYVDGSIIAQLGITDMRLPIQYALTYPDRLDSGLKSMNFVELKKLTFKKPDYKKFPALELAYYALKKGGSLPCVLNAADEEAVESFLEGILNFNSIYDVVAKVVRNHKIVSSPSIKQIMDADIWAREETRKVMSQL
ncbi:MAG: 1-deoxy-D-xylulose-5-phosphate reductoisomerase [Omnitrophica WOR_2 bacterium GWF2_38_59]|nr:MAG: 1-deoxy-D-xylulose-5-phosphate reductoisomerase [Omnitrophica WOR_2 bacterium GWA2_37_7]OGX23819.1 MAG: 1-deoxy-D-xylulose-5-phosphate reductoisomerase [Omnitrophica WOR_2 bacterium GWF2_38_59]OGX47761.1 MAG: 1-deoxy-D-xylulose-5-phosphate reductoisomerase [Omnitrophica WOR_2 bacterium RIFOXYA2_FULL_38_17]OGX51161.1 MAG: 1-deoxy-D-xylulose-5-phosphate reductoisomerase [Omnitrophica WOR_2 bacterium RIFOXYA12_FULL_38_10]OGX56012.1 MAG: 1-deoxy-D-xylulose-5-phosphate reductoisomerase [Omni